MSSPLDKVAEAIGQHEGWQRPDRTWECACGRAYGIKVNFDCHVAQAVIEALGLTQEWGVDRGYRREITGLTPRDSEQWCIERAKFLNERLPDETARVATRLVTPWAVVERGDA